MSCLWNSRWHLVWLWAILPSGSLAAAQQAGADGKPPSPRDEILAAFRQREESISLVEYRVREFPADENGKRVRSRRDFAEDYHIAFSQDGQRYFKGLSYDENNKLSHVSWWIEDGKKVHKISTYEGLPDAVIYIDVEDQVNTATEYQGTMNVFHWLAWPDGKPLSKLIESATKVESAAGGKVSVFVSRQRGDLDVQLDPSHGWLPESISIKHGDSIFTALTFRHEGGHWFPEGGLVTTEDPVGRPSVGFELVELKINEPSTLRLFEPLPPMEGVVVRDITIGGAIRSLPGGREAQEHLLNQYAARAIAEGVAKEPEPVPSRAIASQDPPHFPWGITVMGAGGLALLLAWRLATRRSV